MSEAILAAFMGARGLVNPSAEALVVPELLEPGLFVVRYETVEDLEPARQRRVVEQLRQAAAEGSTGIVFVVSPAVRSIEASVPKFWLGVTGEATYGLRALAVVAESLGVRIAARGFSVANALRAVPVAVDAFEDLPAATAWVRERLGRS